MTIVGFLHLACIDSLWIVKGSRSARIFLYMKCDWMLVILSNATLTMNYSENDLLMRDVISGAVPRWRHLAILKRSRRPEHEKMYYRRRGLCRPK